MENFSKFFDSIVSGNNQGSTCEAKSSSDLSLSPSRYNNDTNINNSINNIYNDDDIKVFPIEDYYLLSNEIILGAIKLHNEIYSSLTVPYAFIAFYMSQFAKYTKFQEIYLRKFLVLFNNKKNNIANAINIFSRTYKNDTSIKVITKNSHIPQLKQSYYIEVSKNLSTKVVGYSDRIEPHLKAAIDSTRKIIDIISTSYKDQNFKYNFLEYVSSNTTTTYVQTTEDNKEKQEEKPVKRKRKVIAPPKQDRQDKVTNISLPVLTTGKIYPTSLTHSRIDSAFFTSNFVESDRLYKIIRNYRFIKVKYTKGFEEKRKALFEVKKSAFDLF